MAKTLTEAEKERARANQEYWEKREKVQAAAYQLEENNLEQRILNRYDYLLTEIDARINDFYQRFARAEGITMNLAEMAVSQMDVKAYNTRAAQLVKDRDFSPKANQELRLYNATMRINRLEMLKSRIGLEMLDTYQQLEDEFGAAFRNRCTEEYERQAGILGQSTSVMPQKDIERILTADFNNANWSSRLWANQGALRDRLSELLTNGIIQGRSVRALARKQCPPADAHGDEPGADRNPDGQLPRQRIQAVHVHLYRGLPDLQPVRTPERGNLRCG